MDVDKLPDRPEGFFDPIILQTGKCPPGQYSEEFLQGMINRLAIGFHRYGPVHAHRADWIRTAEDRLEMYKKDGNTAWLIDVANFIMFGFMFPQHENAHYEETGGGNSPGYITPDGYRRTSTPEKPRTAYDREGD
jgi:hypothetical protein